MLYKMEYKYVHLLKHPKFITLVIRSTDFVNYFTLFISLSEVNNSTKYYKLKSSKSGEKSFVCMNFFCLCNLNSRLEVSMEHKLCESMKLDGAWSKAGETA